MNSGLLTSRRPTTAIGELAERVRSEEKRKRDFVAQTGRLTLRTRRIDEESAQSWLNLEGRDESYGVTPHARRQLATYLGVPVRFADGLQRNHPDLHDNLVNELMHRSDGRRLVRCLDDRCRAFLSDAYQMRDNWDLLGQVVVPEIQRLGGDRVEVASADVTENKLYLKLVFPWLEREVKVGDPVRSGVLISNSEIGAGRTEIQGFVEVLRCTNGMIVPEWGFGRAHVGKRVGGGGDDESYELYADDTRRADNTAFFMKMRDALRATVSEAQFERVVEKLQATAENRVESKPQEAIEEVTKRFGLTEAEGSSILEQFILGQDNTQWGLCNAVTAAARNVEDYDRATDLERIGGEITALSAKDWRTIAERN